MKNLNEIRETKEYALLLDELAGYCQNMKEIEDDGFVNYYLPNCKENWHNPTMQLIKTEDYNLLRNDVLEYFKQNCEEAS